MSNLKSTRSCLVCGSCELAWSSVAVATALAFCCLRNVTTRVDAERLGLWKTVITSFAPC